MKTPALKSHYRKNLDLIDMDYAEKLSPDDLGYLEAFAASYYNGTASDAPGSVPAAEAGRLNAERRRDVYAAFERQSLRCGDVTEVPPYRSPRGEARRRERLRRARKGRAA